MLAPPSSPSPHPPLSSSDQPPYRRQRLHRANRRPHRPCLLHIPEPPRRLEAVRGHLIPLALRRATKKYIRSARPSRQHEPQDPPPLSVLRPPQVCQTRTLHLLDNLCPANRWKLQSSHSHSALKYHDDHSLAYVAARLPAVYSIVVNMVERSINAEGCREFVAWSEGVPAVMEERFQTLHASWRSPVGAAKKATTMCRGSTLLLTRTNTMRVNRNQNMKILHCDVGGIRDCLAH